MSDVSEFVENMQALIDSQKLLNDILMYYSIYDKQFNNADLIRDDKHINLNNRIRSYIKFDDSE